ncbi:hypothetical protein [Methylobacterium sp. AMS5]|uniref:hypothetical protein n=1 Tax=Methylobacterium sp. AMS5 TaxID=925818 RepID=UPI000762DE5F|nr:hypothetical protein [Methylobacterium sp. AMS5]
MPRSLTLALILPLLSWLAATGPASAHRPYFTEAQAILLPDGQRGEMRIIAGDGIFVADPVRIVILDAESRLIARGPQTRWLSLVCDAPLRCHGYDHLSGEVIAPDATTFGRDGPLVPSFDERDDLWGIEAGEASWGVKVRPATWAEWLPAEWSQWRDMPLGGYVLLALPGVIAAICSFGVHRPRWTLEGALLWFAGMLLRLFGVGVAVVMFLLGLIMSPMIPSIVFGAALSAYLLVWIILTLIRRRFKTSVVAA